MPRILFRPKGPGNQGQNRWRRRPAQPSAASAKRVSGHAFLAAPCRSDGLNVPVPGTPRSRGSRQCAHPRISGTSRSTHIGQNAGIHTYRMPRSTTEACLLASCTRLPRRSWSLLRSTRRTSLPARQSSLRIRDTFLREAAGVFGYRAIPIRPRRMLDVQIVRRRFSRA